jgi:hypothetical protein
LLRYSFKNRLAVFRSASGKPGGMETRRHRTRRAFFRFNLGTPLLNQSCSWFNKSV